MKTKLLLIAISSISLLLTSCDKDEMEKGGTSGGGMNGDAMTISSIPIIRSSNLNAGWGIVNVNVTDSKGELVFYKLVDTSLEISPTINGTQLPKGVYSIEISTQDGKTVQNDSFTVE